MNTFESLQTLWEVPEFGVQKLLRIKICKTNLKSFQTIWKVSRHAGKQLNYLEII